ncbi:hypothetical protein M9H77_35460 [Catharanthus roseus]|uniref:Uncharacterized protein n=1 Tax=Catharanthus roseus TaxID=4058 RepID=A0ACB9ZPU3_CATRO|nr:hypothetical protein M9H77_35460 [Catharanthus roseus]
MQYQFSSYHRFSVRVDTKEVRGRRRGGLGGSRYYRPQEEFPRHEAWHEDNLYKAYGDNPNVGQAYHGSYYDNQQVDKALDKIKWKVPSFKGESDLNISLHLERQVENLLMVRIYNNLVKVKLVVAEFSAYALHCLPFSKSVVPKPQASTYKSWPKKEDTPNVAFKDHSKAKVEGKRSLIMNPTWCFSAMVWPYCYKLSSQKNFCL